MNKGFQADALGRAFRIAIDQCYHWGLTKSCADRGDYRSRYSTHHAINANGIDYASGAASQEVDGFGDTLNYQEICLCSDERESQPD
jgi:hypothetical protein